MKKIIRIEAKCNLFEIDKQVEEKKCLPELKRIKKNYEDFQHKTKNDHLSVITSVINPTLF